MFVSIEKRLNESSKKNKTWAWFVDFLDLQNFSSLLVMVVNMFDCGLDKFALKSITNSFFLFFLVTYLEFAIETTS